MKMFTGTGNHTEKVGNHPHRKLIRLEDKSSEIMNIHNKELLFSCQVVSSSSAPPWTVARQAPLSTEVPRQEYWTGLLFPSPGNLPNPEVEPVSPAQAGGLFTT